MTPDERAAEQQADRRYRWTQEKLIDCNNRVHRMELELETVRALLAGVADVLLVAKDSRRA